VKLKSVSERIGTCPARESPRRYGIKRDRVKSKTVCLRMANVVLILPVLVGAPTRFKQIAIQAT
jgi:hypothetical protein